MSALVFDPLKMPEETTEANRAIGRWITLPISLPPIRHLSNHPNRSPKPNGEGEDDKLELGFDGVEEADESHFLWTYGDEKGGGEAKARRR